MHGAPRTFLAIAALATLLCQGLGISSAAAADTPESNPLVLQPLTGPFPSLRGWCRDEVKKNAPRFWVNHCPDRRRLRSLTAPKGAASLISFGGSWQVDQTFWHIAIQTEAGWFVADDMPFCTGRGCANEPGEIEVLPRSDGSTVLLFHFHHTEDSTVGGYVLEEDAQLVILCMLQAKGAPLCTQGTLPISATSVGDRQPGDSGPETRKSRDDDDLLVSVKLALAIEPPRADCMLGLTITAKQRQVRGRNVNAQDWRRRLAALTGQHLLALP